MSRPLTVAERLVDHAARIMPAARRPWVHAMAAELDYVPKGFAAIAFAFGCVQAGYSERIKAMKIFAIFARWTLAGLALSWAGFLALAMTLVVLIKSNPAMTAADLGRDPGTAGTLRLIRNYPAWELGLFAAAAAFLGIGAVLLFRRRPVALAPLAAGVGAATVLSLLDLRLPELSSIRPGGPLDLAVALLVPLLSLAPVWWLCRRAPDLKTSN